MSKLSWNILKDEHALEIIREKSQSRSQVIYKHSTRCFISSIVKNQLERSAVSNDIDFHYLDLVAYRPVSNMIAQEFEVAHESPQILVIKDGTCVYDESHDNISMEEIEKFALTP